jgi:hypothetical protein
MSSLTRRTFLQSALASSVALASNSLADQSWVHSSADPIRVAIVGVGPIGFQQIELFSAIPAVQVVALCDPNTHRLRSAAVRLRQRRYAAPKLTTRLAALLDDPTVDAISIAAAFPGRFVPLAPFLASKKPILFDTPYAVSFSEALCTIRSIATARNILRCRLTDRLAPDAHLLYPNAPSLRFIGEPVEALITSATPSPNQHLSSIPTMACMNLLLSCTLNAKDIIALSEGRELLPLRVASPVGLKSLTFPTNRSFLRKIWINSLGPQTSHTLLQLTGQHGRLSCYASHCVDRETSSRNIIDFLGAIRSSSAEGNLLTQQAYLAAGLLRLTQEPVGNVATARLRSNTNQD